MPFFRKERANILPLWILTIQQADSMKLLSLSIIKFGVFLTLAVSAVAQQSVEVVKVIAQPVDRTLKLPGEFSPYLSVEIHAKVAAFVDKVEVDRGSVVREGQLLASLIAPELTAQRAEAEAKVQALESQRAEAEAKLVAAQSTYERLKQAAETPGVVAGNDVI